MTPPLPHLHPDDELVSAVLDEMATPEERAHVERCATCAARLEELRTVSLAVGEAPRSVTPGQRDGAIAAAVAAVQLTASATVTPLRPVRRRPPAWLLGAAAAVVLVALAVPLLGSLGGGGVTHKAASSAAAPATTAAPSFASAPPAAGAQPGADLGALDDVAALSAAVQSSVRSQALAGDSARQSPEAAAATTAKKATATTASNGTTGCGPPAGAVYTSRVVWRGTPATVYGLGNLPPGMRVVVVADGSCQTLVSTVV
jgi:hypothetical protein